MDEDISPFWEHLATGMWLRILSQDRVKGTIMVREEFPGGRTFQVTLKIIAVKED
jgi:hypothetical protein